MKKIFISFAMMCMAMGGYAATEEDGTYVGWPANYGGVMLQGFWWDSYKATKWTELTSRADELSQYFDLIWIPNAATTSGYENSGSYTMGYDPCYWLKYNSCFGTEDELKTMISTYAENNVGIIEDVVINHKNGLTDWCDFPNESVTVGTTTYELNWSMADICSSDECASNGYTPTGAADTGDDFSGYRDLDHTSTNVQANVKTYANYMLDVMGFAGFRYDMVKGYGPGYINTYNNYAKPDFSVGEYWDNQTNIQNWISNTAYSSAAFDFPLKWKLNSAISGGDYSALEYKSFTYDTNYSQYSVTFVDNHDTGRSSSDGGSPLVYNWSAANAFILASPGTPCVWLKHYNADPTNIGAMILARKACGLTNTGCTVLQQYATSDNGGYVLETQGTNGKVYVQFGNAVGDTPSGYTLVASGDSYKFYSTVYNFARVDISPNGGAFITTTQDVTLTPVNATTSAWYKIGSEGTQNTLSEETTITIGEGLAANTDITIYWGATGDDGVEYTGSSTFTKRELYTPSVTDDELSVFFETDAEEVYIWAWDGDIYYTGDDWSAKPTMTLMGVNESGNLIYKYTCPSTTSGEPTQILFVADGTQTSNFTFVNHGYYTADGYSYEVGEKTIYFDNSWSNWSSVYYYAFDSDGNYITKWPGNQITETNSDGYYEVTLDARYTTVIFNDGTQEGSVGINQTEDLTVVDGKIYSLSAGANTQSGYTVYFDNSSSNWTNVYYYAWITNGASNNSWPGEVITETNSDGYYMVHVDDASYSNIIFNNGNSGSGNQTDDLTAFDGRVYTSSGVTTNLVLTEGYNYYNSSEFTAATAKYSRTTSNQWGTIIMPFDITSDNDVQYYELSSIGSGVMTFEEVSTVSAGHPAVFYLTDASTDLNISLSNVNVIATADDNKWGTDVSSWYMNGTFKATSKASSSSNYIYYIANNAFWCSDVNESIEAKPFRAWFEYAGNSPANVRFRIADGDDETEGIESIQQDVNLDGQIYDLYGRKLAKPKKGFNVINGMKIIIK